MGKMRTTEIRKTSRNHHLRATAIAVLAALVLLPYGAARAADDDSSDDFDNKFFRGVLESLGLRGRDKNIEYRERSPLVVPPNATALPPPDSAASAQARAPANWPVDQDVKRVRDAKAAARKERFRQGDSVQEDARVLRPDELNKSGAPRDGDNAPRQSAEESARPSKPSALGYVGNMFSNAFKGEEQEIAVFRGEPARESLTEPPQGYQTPSPAQPYGLTGVRPMPKAEGKSLEAPR